MNIKRLIETQETMRTDADESAVSMMLPDTGEYWGEYWDRQRKPKPVEQPLPDFAQTFATSSTPGAS